MLQQFRYFLVKRNKNGNFRSVAGSFSNIKGRKKGSET
jgi:hypothetical protein